MAQLKMQKYHHPDAAIAQVKAALLAYAAQYCVDDAPLLRRVAAQLWRVLPRGITAKAAVEWLDMQVSAWGFALLGRHLCAAQIRYAFLESKADPLLLLKPHDGTNAYTSLGRQLSLSLPLVNPPETYTEMPVQSLQSIFVRSPL